MSSDLTQKNQFVLIMTLVPKKKVLFFLSCIANIIYFSILAVLYCAVVNVFIIGSINPRLVFPEVFTKELSIPLLFSIITAIGIHKEEVSSIIIDEKAELLTIHYKSSLSLFAKSHVKEIPFSELEYCCEQRALWMNILNYFLLFIPKFRITLFSKSRLKFVFSPSCGWTREQYPEIISALQTIKAPKDPKDLLF